MIIIKKSTYKAPIALAASLLIGSLFSSVTYAELSIGALAGLANYTTVNQGDAIYDFGGPGFYYRYPGDVNSKDFAGGFTGRYLREFNPAFSLGVEAGYVFIDQDVTRNKVDDFIPTSNWVENFNTKSNGVVLANAVARWSYVPSASFSLFGGPAWLNTNYTENDFFDGIQRNASSSYQLTGDLGLAADWQFKPAWSIGMRFDYIFNTDDRTVASTGSLGDPLLFNNVAKSGLTLFTAQLRYIFPEHFYSMDK